MPNVVNGYKMVSKLVPESARPATSQKLSPYSEFMSRNFTTSHVYATKEQLSQYAKPGVVSDDWEISWNDDPKNPTAPIKPSGEVAELEDGSLVVVLSLFFPPDVDFTQCTVAEFTRYLQLYNDGHFISGDIISIMSVTEEMAANVEVIDLTGNVPKFSVRLNTLNQQPLSDYLGWNLLCQVSDHLCISPQYALRPFIALHGTASGSKHAIEGMVWAKAKVENVDWADVMEHNCPEYAAIGLYPGADYSDFYGGSTIPWPKVSTEIACSRYVAHPYSKEKIIIPNWVNQVKLHYIDQGLDVIINGEKLQYSRWSATAKCSDRRFEPFMGTASVVAMKETGESMTLRFSGSPGFSGTVQKITVYKDEEPFMDITFNSIPSYSFY